MSDFLGKTSRRLILNIVHYLSFNGGFQNLGVLMSFAEGRCGLLYSDSYHHWLNSILKKNLQPAGRNLHYLVSPGKKLKKHEREINVIHIK